jgi:ABC-type multidrug transport system fused ATPase/permease subunit
MKNFLRSLRYLWTYRFRLLVAVVCVVAIAALWGGGLGMMLPATKVLISDEGLHGWAWREMTHDRLGALVNFRPAESGTKPIAGQNVSTVLDVVSVDAKSPGAGRLMPGMWLAGVREGDQIRITPANDLARAIGTSSPGAVLELVAYSPSSLETSVVPVTAGELQFTTSLLGYAATTIPEPQDRGGRFWLFAGLLVVVLAITYIRGLFTFAQEYLVGTAVWCGIMDLRCELYNVVLHLPTTFFSEKGVSDATSRFINDTGELARGQNTLLGKTLVEPAKAIASVTVALLANWPLTLVAMIGGPPAFWLIRRLGKKMHKASRRALENWSGLMGVLEETLLGIRVVKAYTMEGSERRRFFRVNRELLKQQNRMELLDAASGPLVEVLGITAGLVAAGVAAWLVFMGMWFLGAFRQMDTGVFITWLVALFAMFDPVRKLAKVTLRFQQADAAGARIFELLDSPPEKFLPNAPSLGRHSRSIEFRGVTYRYPNASFDAVRNVSLRIEAGQTVAVVGPNGSGKTTLLSLLPRLLEPTPGTIFIDGQDITQVSIRSLRRQIGLVTQDNVLFAATIRENIAYGLRRPREAAVLDAAQKAFVDEFVRDLPAGYDTMVGEHGSTLSGGQRQRLAIARAILRDPAILIFDEAMSQVDSQSEQRITEAMAEFVKGRTTLLIAHRFATILTADMIVVMDNGRIVDHGRHEDLLARCTIYRHLYQTQFADAVKQL